MKIVKDPTDHNFSSRDGNKISLVVVHHTASMNISGTISWFKNSQSQASAHYVIGLDGTTIEMVPEGKKAWHAGKSSFKGKNDSSGSVNKFSIGIELVGDGNKQAYTDAQYTSLIELCRDIKTRVGLSDECFTGHEFISPGRKNDPGKFFDWKRFLKGVCNDQIPGFITTAEEPDAAGYKSAVEKIAKA